MTAPGDDAAATAAIPGAAPSSLGAPDRHTASPLLDAPLVAFDAACIDCGHFTTEPLVGSGGTRLVALVGYASPFFRLLRGEARLARGAVRLAGLDANRAVQSGTVAVASRGTPPLRTSVRRFLAASARLSLVPRRDIGRRVNGVLERFRLTAVADFALSDLPDPTRRVVSLARTTLGDASIVVAEAPFAELDLRSYAEIHAVLEVIATERRLVVSFPAEPEADRGHAFVSQADFRVDLQG